MGNNFKRSIELQESETGFCGNEGLENTSNLSQEDLDSIRVEKVKVGFRKGRYKTLKNSSRTSLPYISPDSADLIYIPIVFHQFRSETDSWEPTDTRAYSSAYTEAFYTEVIDYLNSFVAGEHIPPIGTIGAAKDHVDHGVISKIRFKQASHIPGRFLSSYLDNSAWHNADAEEVLRLAGATSFYYTNSIIETAQAEATANREAAETTRDNLIAFHVALGLTDAEAENEIIGTPEDIAYQDALYLEGLGGLIGCGTEGAVFTYNVSKYDHCTLGLLHEDSVEPSEEDFCVNATCIDDLDYLGRCTRGEGTPMGHMSGTRIYEDTSLSGGPVMELGRWGNTIPVMNIWTTIGGLHLSEEGWSGLGPSPDLALHGNLYMNSSSAFDDSSYKYAQVLLHEFGHSFGLPHAFQGGAIKDLKDKVYPSFNFPLGVTNTQVLSNTYTEALSHVDYIGEQFERIANGEGYTTLSDLYIPHTHFVSSLIVGESLTIADFTNCISPNGVNTSLGFLCQDVFSIPVNKLEGWEGEGLYLKPWFYNFDSPLLFAPIVITRPDSDYSVAITEANFSMFAGEELAQPGDIIHFIDLLDNDMNHSTGLLLGGFPLQNNSGEEISNYNTSNYLTFPISTPLSAESVIYLKAITTGAGFYSIGSSTFFAQNNAPHQITIIGIAEGEEIVLNTWGDLVTNIDGGYEQIEFDTFFSDIDLNIVESITHIKILMEGSPGIIDLFHVYSNITIIEETEVTTGDADFTLTQEYINLHTLPPNEKIFTELYYSEIAKNLDFGNLKRFELGETPEGLIYKDLSSLIWDNNMTTVQNILLFDNTLNPPSFWGGSVDETQINSQGNASLVFNRIAEESNIVDLSTVAITNDYLSNIIYNESSGQIEMQTSGFNVNLVVWGKITLSADDLGTLSDGHSLIIESASAIGRHLAIKQYFSVGGTSIDSVVLSAESAASIPLSLYTNQVDILLIESSFPNEEITVISAISITHLSRPVNIITRVPFCKLDADGNPTDILDEFWSVNGNWLNPDFPAYPDNWPTGKAYDEFDAEGNSLCPCLYATQHYKKSGVISSFNPITDREAYFSYLEAEVVALESTSLQSGYLNVFYALWRSVYNTVFNIWEQYDFLRFTSSNSYYRGPNGHMPLFGYYGYSPFQGMPQVFGLSVDENSQDFYTYDDLLSDTPRYMKASYSTYSELLHRVSLGSSDPTAPNYNPFKIDVDLDYEWERCKFAVDKVEGATENPYYGIQTPVGTFNINAMHHCMNYDTSHYQAEGVDGTFSDYSWHTLRGYRIIFSVEGIFRSEAILEQNRGKWGDIQTFSRAADVRNSYSTSSDAQNTIAEIEAFIENYGILAQGCTDPTAVNYDEEAEINDGSCMYPGDACVFPTATIDVCIDSNILTCNQVDQTILDNFPPGDTLSVILYSDEYPQAPEGCTGGGFQYSIATEECVYGELEIVGCAGGETFTTEEIVALGEEHYILVCPDARYTLTANLYTSGGIYFTASGESYSGVYCVRSGGVAFSGSLKLSGERLYTRDQLSKAVKVLDSLEDTAKKFVKIQKNIENICRFVKL